MEEETRQRILDGEARTDLFGGERVVALARSIVADIALYHEGEVRGGDGSLTEELAEGRRLLLEMVDADELGDVDPIGSAFAEVVRALEGSR